MRIWDKTYVKINHMTNPIALKKCIFYNQQSPHKFPNREHFTQETFVICDSHKSRGHLVIRTSRNASRLNLCEVQNPVTTHNVCYTNVYIINNIDVMTLTGTRRNASSISSRVSPFLSKKERR